MMIERQTLTLSWMESKGLIPIGDTCPDSLTKCVSCRYRGSSDSEHNSGIQIMQNLVSSVGEYRDILHRELNSRQLDNPLYSARAFAKSLGISKTSLAATLQRNRHLSRKNALKIATRLCFSPDETKEMLASIKSTAPQIDAPYPSFCLRDDTFRVIADWYHYAILSLAKMRTNRSSPEWIASRLGISSLDAKTGLDRLKRLGLIECNGFRMRRRVGSLDTTHDVPSSAIRKFHKQNLRLAELSIERDSVAEREITSLTIAFDPKRIERVRSMIRKFRTRMASYLESDNPSRVYNFSIQFFPVSSKGVRK